MEAGDYTHVEGYELGDALGMGGMGTVYRARQIEFDRDVALKLIHPHLARDAAFRERFKEEMHTAIALEHPNVVPVYEIGEGSTLFISMLLVPGRDLASRVNSDGPLELEEAVTILRQIASALDEAHRKRIIHRDVKPPNVIVDERITHAYLTDFGLARSLDATSGFTATGHRMGTIDYMSPEQIDGGAVDHRSDIYALACLFYAIVTGRRPFAGDTDAAVIRAKMRGPSSPRLDDEGFSTELADVVEKAQSERPEDRFDSAGAFAAALELALKGVAMPATRQLPVPRDEDQTETMEPPTEPPTQRQPRRSEPAPAGVTSSSRWPLIGIGLAALVALAAGTAFMVGNSSSGGSSSKSKTTTTTTTTTSATTTTTSSVGDKGSAPAGQTSTVPLERFNGDYFTAKVPAGWTPEMIDEKDGQRTTSQWRDPADDNTSVLIDNQPVDLSLTPREGAEGVRAQTSQTPGYEEISFEDITIHGVPAVKWVFDLKEEGDRRVDYFFNGCNRGFAVLGSTSPERFPEMEPTFEKVANSVYDYCE